jgi:glutaconyl-CoA/methylmalonyl-CoA decarboxylase subunit gamma
MKKYVIKLNGKVYEVEMEEVTGEAAATVVENTKTVQAVPQSEPQPSTQSAPAVSGGEVVEAPMPGNILNVAVKVGDMIKKGQVLVVLEAMKMENEIVAPVDGKVVSVGVSKGETVNAGDTLVQIA